MLGITGQESSRTLLTRNRRSNADARRDRECPCSAAVPFRLLLRLPNRMRSAPRHSAAVCVVRVSKCSFSPVRAHLPAFRDEPNIGIGFAKHRYQRMHKPHRPCPSGHFEIVFPVYPRLVRSIRRIRVPREIPLDDAQWSAAERTTPEDEFFSSLFAHSDRNAIAGSTRVALRAGRYAAANATTPSSRHAAPSATGSVGWT